MYQDLLFQLALTEVPQVGNVHAKQLVQHFGSAEAIFKASLSTLEKIEGIGTIRARNIKFFNSFNKSEEEISQLEKYSIIPLFINDKNYPQRLLNCYDSPALLFYKGTASLNASKMVAIIGTRSNTDYGRKITEELVRGLASLNVVVISGLAFGIDAIAHKAALRNAIPTVAVVAHGLSHLYPPEHVHLAKDIVKHSGGLLTEHRLDVKPDKHFFPVRNRIVAGICDATIVIETGIKGGSMITADLANGYNKDVFAFPGKTTDVKSAGCNHLVKTNKAILLTDAAQLVEIMGWQEKTQNSNDKNQINQNKQRQLFIELAKEERIIVDIINERQTANIDEINFKSGLTPSAVAATLLNLELRGVIMSLPGKLYKLA